jgi:hypothetical protein
VHHTWRVNGWLPKAQFAILFGERFTRTMASTDSTAQAIHGILSLFFSPSSPTSASQ